MLNYDKVSVRNSIIADLVVSRPEVGAGGGTAPHTQNSGLSETCRENLHSVGKLSSENAKLRLKTSPLWKNRRKSKLLSFIVSSVGNVQYMSKHCKNLISAPSGHF